jgi:hypothetical protein
VTVCVKRNFEDDLWFLPVLFTGFRKYWDYVEAELGSVIHFVYLFKETESEEFWEFICSQLAVETEENDKLIPQICERLKDPEEWGNEALKWFIGSPSLKLATHSLSVYNQIQKPSMSCQLLPSTVLYHVRNSPDECSELILESFIFLAANFTGNETLAAQFLISFLDSSLYIQTSAHLLLKVLSSRLTSGKAWPFIIPLIRPMIPRLERNDSIQKLFDLFIKTSHNEELMLIVSPLKHMDGRLFQSSKPPLEVVNAASEATMCKCISHYARMVNEASVRLLNSLFLIATIILTRVKSQENNRIPLARLYTIALHTIQQCPNSFSFISKLIVKEPTVSTTTFFSTVEGERSVEDIKRSLKRIVPVAELPVNVISDCKSFLNVVKFPEMTEQPPRIMPFAAQEDMLDGMIKIADSFRITRERPSRELTSGHSFGSSMRISLRSQSSVIGFAELTSDVLCHPTRLMEEGTMFNEKPIPLVYSLDEFLAAPNI